MQLITNQLEPMHWALAGLGIAAVTLGMLWLGNRALGISSGFENLCSLVSKTPYLHRSELVGSAEWRLPFLLGLVLGGALSAILGGGWSLTWNMGMFDTAFGSGVAPKVAVTFLGGTLLGVGARLAGGCTSGHSIFGIASLRASSLVSTVCFMVAGAVTTNVVYRVLAPMLANGTSITGSAG